MASSIDLIAQYSFINIFARLKVDATLLKSLPEEIRPLISALVSDGMEKELGE